MPLISSPCRLPLRQTAADVHGYGHGDRTWTRERRSQPGMRGARIDDPGSGRYSHATRRAKPSTTSLSEVPHMRDLFGWAESGALQGTIQMRQSRALVG